MDDSTFDVRRSIYVYVVKGTLDGRAVTLFLTQGGVKTDAGVAYCIFNDAWTGKPLLKIQTSSPNQFNIEKAKGSLIQLESLVGSFQSDNKALYLFDYMVKYQKYTKNQFEILLASGDLGTMQSLFDLYKKYVPESEWYIAP